MYAMMFWIYHIFSNFVLQMSLKLLNCITGCRTIHREQSELSLGWSSLISAKWIFFKINNPSWKQICWIWVTHTGQLNMLLLYLVFEQSLLKKSSRQEKNYCTTGLQWRCKLQLLWTSATAVMELFTALEHISKIPKSIVANTTFKVG